MKSTESLIHWSGVLLLLLAACQPIFDQSTEIAKTSNALPPGVVPHPLYVFDATNAHTKKDRDADKSATFRAFKEANDIFQRDETKIVVDGLFADNRVLSEQPIAWLLVANRIPFIETNIDDARWVFFHAKRPGEEALKARGKRFVRFKLARDGDSSCFRGDDEGPYHSFAVRVPQEGGECVVVEFADELRSKYRLGIDLKEKSSRRAYYEILELGSNRSILRVPFWNIVLSGILLLPGDNATYSSSEPVSWGLGTPPNGIGTYYSSPAGPIGHVLARLRGPAYPH